MMNDVSIPHGKKAAAAYTDRVLEIKETILAAGDLPTLPLVALEVTRLAENPLSSAAEMVRLIRNDPSLTARILRVANSSYYGMPRRIDSLNTAIVALGMREISNLVTSISVVKTFPGREDEQTFNLQAFWEHSAGSAEVARMISTKLHLHLRGAEFTAALLHDVGKIVLDQYFHEESLKAREIQRAEHLPSSEAERRVLGVDHAEIGAWLAERWSLPPAIAEAIRYHHDPHLASLDSLLAGVVHLADLMSKAIAEEEARDSWNRRLISDEVWEILAQGNPEIRRLDIATFAEEVEENIQRAREFTRSAFA
jgi:putative nucleotidyltransferase with HDIG domain